MSARKIVYLAANPIDTDRLALDLESRAIEFELERARYRRFEFLPCWGAPPSDLMRILRRHRPTVVQFSGHGYRAGEGRSDRAAPHRDVTVASAPGGIELGLCFQGRGGHLQIVPNAALKDAFGVAGTSVKLVVLNACWSEQLATSLLAHVDCVVGMDGAIGDEAARHFSVGLYAGIGAGASVEEAFKQGRAAIGMEGLPDSDRPQLKVRDSVDAGKLVLAKDARNRGRGRRP